jgi:acid phosphatase
VGTNARKKQGGFFMRFKSLGRSVSGALIVGLLAASALAQVPLSQRVVLVIDENHSFSEVVANMPWLVEHGNGNGYATNYHSDNSGSLMNYLWLASGSCHSSVNCTLPAGTHNFNCTGNSCYYPSTNSTDSITDDNIFRELNNAGISWKVYAQSYAAAGGTVTSPDNNNGSFYYRRHNGATWYSDILNNVGGSAENVVDLSQLATDLANGQLPRFMIIVPDGNHDAHDCPVGMSTCSAAQTLEEADDFLSATLDPILGTAEFQPGGDGLLIVTFDECASGTNKGCAAAVYTALIGPRVTPHTVSSVSYKHENTLRTMLDSLGITAHPGASAAAAAMSDFFAVNRTQPEVVISSPANGASLSSPASIQASAVSTVGHTITGWRVYVDGSTAYSAGAVAALNATLNMSTGAHTVLIRVWDSSGAFDDQTLTLTIGAVQPAVTILTPSNFANIGSPVNLQAGAASTPGQRISGWWIYVDGVRAYNAGPTDKINANIPMTLGVHKVVVRAWDTSGASGDQRLSLTISNKPAVAVSTPANGANVISPINVRASATASNGHWISGWWVYLDGVRKYQAGSSGSINANIAASSGSHKLVVRVWDTTGAYGDQTITVTVP